MTKKMAPKAVLLFLLLWPFVSATVTDGSGASCSGGSCSIENHQNSNADKHRKLVTMTLYRNFKLLHAENLFSYLLLVPDPENINIDACLDSIHFPF